MLVTGFNVGLNGVNRKASIASRDSRFVKTDSRKPIPESEIRNLESGNTIREI